MAGAVTLIQLEDGDVLVVTPTGEVTPERRKEIEESAAKFFPGTSVLLLEAATLSVIRPKPTES